MRVLALDFDGVICDSAREAFSVALQAWADLHPGTRLATLARNPHPDDHPELYAHFVGCMPLGNRAEDYGVVLAAAEEGATFESQDGYDRFRAGLKASWLDAFHRRFYEVRSAWSAREPEAWLATMAPYPGFLELLRRRAGDAELAIATAKDGASVSALLVRHGVADLFPGDRVLDKDTGVSKRAHLQLLAERVGCPVGEITFVDDKVNHLESVAPLGARCALAAWGYNGPREHARARECGFLVLTLEDAETQLYG